MSSEPVSNSERLVRAVVVHDQVDVQHCRHVGFDGAQELQKAGVAAKNAPRWIKMLRKHGFIATPATA